MHNSTERIFFFFSGRQMENWEVILIQVRWVYFWFSLVLQLGPVRVSGERLHYLPEPLFLNSISISKALWCYSLCFLASCSFLLSLSASHPKHVLFRMQQMTQEEIAGRIVGSIVYSTLSSRILLLKSWLPWKPWTLIFDSQPSEYTYDKVSVQTLCPALQLSSAHREKLIVKVGLTLMHFSSFWNFDLSSPGFLNFPLLLQMSVF